MYLSDYAHWVLAALAGGRPGETYNVGSAEPVDLLALANAITRFFTPVPEVRTRVGQAGHDRNRLVPDTAKIQRDLVVSQTVPLEAALQKTVEWHRAMQG